MVSTQQIIFLLIVDDSAEHCESILKELRNHGYAVRDRRVTTLDGLSDALTSETWDLLLFKPSLESCPLQDVLRQIQKNQLDIPVIALFDTEQAVDKSLLINAAVQDCLSINQPDHLRHVIKRELQSLNDRRQLRQLHIRYQESERRCRSLLASSRDAIAYIHDGMHHFCNDAYLALFGFENADELEGLPLLDLVETGQREHFKRLLKTLAQGVGIDQQQTFLLQRADDGNFKALLKFATASIEGEPCLQLTVQDLTEHEVMEEKLQLMSQQDLVTGLLNRSYFLQQLDDHCIHLAPDQPQGALMVMRVDLFDDIKDKVGIANCDILLCDIAGLIRETLPVDALAGRYSDDAFTLLLPDADTAEAFCGELRQTIEKNLFDVDNHSLTATCSIGLVALGGLFSRPQAALAAADSACMQARNHGGNLITWYREQQVEHITIPTLQASGLSVDSLREAIEQDDFRLVYQPIVSLHAEPGERYEILLRLHTAGREIAPGEFLPLAEQHDLMPDIDRLVIKKAITQLAIKRRNGKNTRFFIKLSKASICDPSLLPWISAYIKAARLPGDALIFEVNETELFNTLKQVVQLSAGLTELRCELAIDHVGESGQAMNYLKHLEFKYVKISGALITGMIGDTTKQELVKKIAAMSQANGKLAIAEFVHDANTLATLWQYGINFVQGFYLQKPNNEMNYDFSLE